MYRDVQFRNSDLSVNNEKVGRKVVQVEIDIYVPSPARYLLISLQICADKHLQKKLLNTNRAHKVPVLWHLIAHQISSIRINSC